MRSAICPPPPAVEIVMMTIRSDSNRRFAMADRKPLGLGILVWAALSTVVQADPIGSPNQFNWVAYFAGQPGSAPVPAPAAAPAVVTQTQAPQLQVSAPVPSPSVSVLANAPVAQPQVMAPATSSAPVDAFVNLGNGPYPLENSITTGNAGAWYNSSQITGLFGGQPTAQQIQSFDSAVLQQVQQTFSLSGVGVTLTDNPNVAALHTLSLVSNTSSATLSSAIGMTQVGASGFSFIDKIAPSAQSIDQLESIVAHNISHELMLAFGVPENYNQSGNFIDSTVANWAMMVSPTATFSPAAAQAINQALAAQSTMSSAPQLGAQLVSDQVPEPATLVLWTVAGAALIVARRRSRGSRTTKTQADLV
jgi:hypothetical protein